ncbi:MAG: hypothetical protein QHI38_13505, partial [Armatimonadota bacterium]|nr:hypothetical protein [Armatimonadota bacterium]
GDVNMLALGQNVLAPGFHELYPNVTVATVHTGPGDAGSRLIFEKLLAVGYNERMSVECRWNDFETECRKALEFLQAINDELSKTRSA